MVHVPTTRAGRRSLVVSTVALGPALVADVLKDVLVRPQLLADATSNSLPSGHVAAVAGLAGAAWIATDRKWRPATAALGDLVVAATGLATITRGWHRPSDVIASGLIALAAVALASIRPAGDPARTSTYSASTGFQSH